MFRFGEGREKRDRKRNFTPDRSFGNEKKRSRKEVNGIAWPSQALFPPTLRDHESSLLRQFGSVVVCGSVCCIEYSRLYCCWFYFAIIVSVRFALYVWRKAVVREIQVVQRARCDLDDIQKKNVGRKQFAIVSCYSKFFPYLLAA